MANLNKDSADFQEFLETSQYSKSDILRDERICGRGFLSNGGPDSTLEFLKELDLKPDDYVLDVGCGIGGSAFMMEKEYGARVLGVDLSQNTNDIALLRQKEVNSVKTTFVVDDIITATYNDDEFDVIYSRDTLVHIANKKAVFTNFFKWLKPGGRLFLTDFCRKGGHSPEFDQYAQLYRYHIITTNAYEQLVKDCGFENIVVKDISNKSQMFASRELDRLVAMKDEYIKEFSQFDYDDNLKIWQDKIDRGTEGEEMWISLSARKPSY